MPQSVRMRLQCTAASHIYATFYRFNCKEIHLTMPTAYLGMLELRRTDRMVLMKIPTMECQMEGSSQVNNQSGLRMEDVWW
jgi:hypothetical protein